MVKARLSGRSGLHATDIEETFDSLNLEKVYGAATNPEFIPFGDEGLYYLNVCLRVCLSKHFSESILLGYKN